MNEACCKRVVFPTGNIQKSKRAQHNSLCRKRALLGRVLKMTNKIQEAYLNMQDFQKEMNYFNLSNLDVLKTLKKINLVMSALPLLVH